MCPHDDGDTDRRALFSMRRCRNREGGDESEICLVSLPPPVGNPHQQICDLSILVIGLARLAGSAEHGRSGRTPGIAWRYRPPPYGTAAYPILPCSVASASRVAVTECAASITSPTIRDSALVVGRVPRPREVFPRHALQCLLDNDFPSQQRLPAIYPLAVFGDESTGGSGRVLHRGGGGEEGTSADRLWGWDLTGPCSRNLWRGTNVVGCARRWDCCHLGPRWRHSHGRSRKRERWVASSAADQTIRVITKHTVGKSGPRSRIRAR